MNDVFDPQMSAAFRSPPANLDAEKALLGALLQSPRFYERVAETLRAEHFALPVHGRVYEAMAKMIDIGSTPSVVTLKTYLDGDDLLQRAGGIRYLAELAASMIGSANVADYGRLIRDLYLRRRLIAIGDDLVSRAYLVGDERAEQTIEHFEAQLTELTAGGGHDQEVSFARALDDTLAEWQAADQDQAGGVSTGLEAIDAIIGRMQGGDLMFIAGNTSMGKTALATTIAINAAMAAVPTAFFSLEMSHRQLVGRVLTGLTAVPGPRQRRWKLEPSHWDALTSARIANAELPMTIRHAPGLTLPALRSACRRLKRRGLGLVIVDYLQIMGRTREDRFENRVREISELTMGLKTMAGELDLPVIVLSQLSRENWKRDNPRPQLSDLRDSGSIEQDADTVIFCFREEYFLERNTPTRRDGETAERWNERWATYQSRLEDCAGMAEAIIAKNRHGPPGTAKLAFDAARAWFSDLPDHQRQIPPQVRDPSAPQQTAMEL